MSHPERFSPAKEIKQLEKQRVDSGMLAVYADLWDPIEKGRKEEILEAGVREIIMALQAKDYARAGGLMRSLRRYYEEDAIKERMALKEYHPQSPAESETVLEVRNLFKDLDWEKALEQLQSDSSYPRYFLSVAGRIRRFDAQRFDKEIKISDDQWKRLVVEVERDREYALHFLYSASRLKELDPERFQRDVKMDDGDWNRIVAEMEKDRDFPYSFVKFYEMAQSIDAEKIQERVPIEKDYWEKIELAIERNRCHPDCEAMIVGSAQRIKPEGLSDITVSRERWEKMKYELEDMLKFDAPLGIVFAYANDLMNIKVE